MTDLAAFVAPLADLDSRQWVGILCATVAAGAYSTVMVLAGMWIARR